MNAEEFELGRELATKTLAHFQTIIPEQGDGPAMAALIFMKHHCQLTIDKLKKDVTPEGLELLEKVDAYIKDQYDALDKITTEADVEDSYAAIPQEPLTTAPSEVNP